MIESREEVFQDLRFAGRRILGEVESREEDFQDLRTEGEQEGSEMAQQVPTQQEPQTQQEPEQPQLRQKMHSLHSLRLQWTLQPSQQGQPPAEDGSRRRTLRCAFSFALLSALLAVLFVWNVNSGSVDLTVREIFGILTGRGGDETAVNIIWQIRLPRILAAVILGGALSVSGFLLQTFFHNPIAGPFVLGISSGAKLVVALSMIFLLGRGITASSTVMVLAAFFGSMISMGFVLAVSRKVRQMSMLVICGVMISYICSAVTDFVVTFADDSNIVNLHNWSLGSFSGTTWNNVAVMAAIVFLAVLLTFLLSKPIGAYQLGEDYARNLGVNVRVFRVCLILLSSILSACVTAFAGPVSFVGIAVPHLVKNIWKTSKPIVVVPACFLGGAVFCLFCDLIARTVFAPTELSISSVTAIFGAPVVIFIMIRRRKAT